MVVMQAVFYILLFFFGNAFCTVLHFIIEDSLGTSPESTLFFLKEYNRCFAAIVVLTLILSVMLYLRERMIRKTSSVEEYEAKSTFPLLNCQICDVVLGIALLGAIVRCIILFYSYLSLLPDLFETFLKTSATLLCLSLLILYSILEKKRIYAGSKKLYYLIVGGIMLSFDSITVFAVFKYANPAVFARIIEDCHTLETVKDLGSKWIGRQYKNTDELLSSLDESKRNVLKTKDISCGMNDNASIAVKFNLISSPEDFSRIRADQRLDHLHRYSYFSEHNSYKTGQNIKNFVRKKK
ncbi:MAG: hypothetical protein LBJ96_05310 [Holosporaceae bacterium]|jgi:hypothetical protein|nr:hypothetical protein [Holosporaceae bacterium]